MAGRVWSVALSSLFVAVVVFAGDTRVSPFEPAAIPRAPRTIENAAITSPAAIDPRELLDDPRVAALFAHLFQLGGSGVRDSERAAFLVKEPDDTWSCMLWPARGRFRSEEYRGRVPDGVVAIVHTHPNRMVHASRGDEETAMRTGLPLFTVTWGAVTLVDPASGEEEWVARHEDWRKAIPASFRADAQCREIAPDTRPRREGLVASGQ